MAYALTTPTEGDLQAELAALQARPATPNRARDIKVLARALELRRRTSCQRLTFDPGTLEKNQPREVE